MNKNESMTAPCGLECCVDNRGFRYCSRCSDFPCGRLKEWATKSDKYEKALENLMRLARQ